MTTNKQRDIEDRIRSCLWDAYYHGNWEVAIEEIKTQMKLLSELHDEDKKYWDDYNESDLK